MDMDIIADRAVEFTYPDLATWLHSIADCIDIAGEDAPVLVPATWGVRLSIVPDTRHPEAERIATVDILGLAVLGHGGSRESVGGGPTGWSYGAKGRVGTVDVAIHTTVSAPAPDEVQAELIRLRAENEHLRRELGEPVVA